MNTEFSELTSREKERYSRHILMPSIGLSGVKKLRQSTVIIIGAGGIAQSLLTYLTSSGIGEIILIDFDHIEPSNLARQFLYTEADIGKPKAEVAAAKLNLINPTVKITPLVEKVTAENFVSILTMNSSLINTHNKSNTNSSSHPLSLFPLIVETVDTLKNKLLLHDLAFTHNFSLVHGAALAHEGQFLTIIPPQSNNIKTKQNAKNKNHTCLRCYFPHLGQTNTANQVSQPSTSSLNFDKHLNTENMETDSCAVEGVLAPMCGIIGSLQAAEVIRYYTNPHTILTHNMLHINLNPYRFRLLPPQVKNCNYCGYSSS